MKLWIQVELHVILRYFNFFLDKIANRCHRKKVYERSVSAVIARIHECSVYICDSSENVIRYDVEGKNILI